MLNGKEQLNNQGGVTTAELEVSKTYEEVQEGDEVTQSEYVKFDAFFLRDLDGDGYAESIRGACREIGGEDTLYMELNVNSIHGTKCNDSRISKRWKDNSKWREFLFANIITKR